MDTRNPVVTALTVVAAAVGGWVGILILDLGTVRSLVVLAFGTLLGTAIALLAVERDQLQAGEPVPPPVEAPRPPVYAHAAPEPAPPPTTANSRTWWTETPAQPAAVRTEARAASLESYDADRAVVAQCPRCGDFRLDVEQDADVYAFHCRNPNCGNRWEWRAGAPWPTTVVRRNLTG